MQQKQTHTESDQPRIIAPPIDKEQLADRLAAVRAALGQSQSGQAMLARADVRGKRISTAEAAPDLLPLVIAEAMPSRQEVVIPAGAYVESDAVARNEHFSGMKLPGDIAFSFSATDSDGTEHAWVVVRPTAEEQPKGSVIRRDGVSRAAASILRVTSEPGKTRSVVNEQEAVRLLAGETVTIQDLMAGEVREGSAVYPQLEAYGQPGNGLIHLDYYGSMAVNTVRDDPAIELMYPQQAQLTTVVNPDMN